MAYLVWNPAPRLMTGAPKSGRALMLAACLALPWQSAAALTTCRFETECFEAETCDDSGFEIELNGDVSEIWTEYSTLRVVYDHVGRAGFSVMAEDGGAVYLLTIAPDDSARLSVHMEGPVAVTYLGSCEGGE